MARTRPNILWICADQQRFDTVHALGNEHIRTSNLDRLIREGVAFTRAYAQSPICTPSRASFLTGCYPSAVHVNRNGNAYFPEDAALITRLLQEAGYDCGLAGKLHLSAADGRVELRLNDGYRVFQWNHHPYPERFWPLEKDAYQRWLRRQGVEWNKAYGGKWFEGQDELKICCSGIAAKYHQTTWCAEEAIAFMSEPRQGPWLMSVNPFDPHPSFDPPPTYMERMDVAAMPLPLFRPEEMQTQHEFSEIDHQTTEPQSPYDYDARAMIAAYYAQIELIDDQLGRMLNAIEESGQRENTIVIFMSDHGEMLGDHGLLRKGCRFYEGAVHVPLVVSWPTHFREGLRSNALVELTDIVPALLEAVEMPIPERIQGRSLLPILTGKSDPHKHRDFVRCEYHDALELPHHSHANMIFDGRYKFVTYHGKEDGELYDLSEDPHEFQNLWRDPASEKLKHGLMRRCFDAVMLATDAGQPRVGAY